MTIPPPWGLPESLGSCSPLLDAWATRAPLLGAGILRSVQVSLGNLGDQGTPSASPSVSLPAILFLRVSTAQHC